MAKGLFNPKSYSTRDPLDNKRKHGNIVNPPRMAGIGGLDSARGNAHHQNDMSLQKPGGGKRSSK